MPARSLIGYAYMQVERLKYMNEKCAKNHRNNADVEVCCKITDTSSVGEAEAAAADAAEECVETRRRRACDFDEPVCINTSQIYDSCRDRDCVSGARVYLTEYDQRLIDNAINVKLRKAEIIWVYTNVEPLSFNNGYFSIDLKFFVRTTLDVFTGVCNPTTIYGLTTFDKRVILFGSEGNSKVFKSNLNCDDYDLASCMHKTSLPTVVVETVEPVALNAKLVEKDCCCCDCDDDTNSSSHADSSQSESFFPRAICSCFDDDLVTDTNRRLVEVTFGLFSIIRLERDSQLLIDAVDFCIPTRECSSTSENSPCDLFNEIRFPIDEFFPPQKAQEDNGCNCGCGCK